MPVYVVAGITLEAFLLAWEKGNAFFKNACHLHL